MLSASKDNLNGQTILLGESLDAESTIIFTKDTKF